MSGSSPLVCCSAHLHAIHILNIGILRSPIALLNIDSTRGATQCISSTNATLCVHVAVPGLGAVDPDGAATAAATTAVATGAVATY